MRHDFIKVRSFDAISRGFQNILMASLNDFLEQNNFNPTREEVEAILRRCDHDANRTISYDEFCELVANE